MVVIYKYLIFINKQALINPCPDVLGIHFHIKQLDNLYVVFFKYRGYKPNSHFPYTIDGYSDPLFGGHYPRYRQRLRLKYLYLFLYLFLCLSS